LKAEGLLIDEIRVTSGPRMKRYRPVARGMAHPFQKRTSHIYITLSGDEAEKKASTTTTVKKTTTKAAKKGDK
jgi:large subunit ribosomal protein L22